MYPHKCHFKCYLLCSCCFTFSNRTRKFVMPLVPHTFPSISQSPPSPGIILAYFVFDFPSFQSNAKLTDIYRCVLHSPETTTMLAAMRIRSIFVCRAVDCTACLWHIAAHVACPFLSRCGYRVGDLVRSTVGEPTIVVSQEW